MLFAISKASGQGVDTLSYEFLSLHDWRIDSAWFGSKHIVLQALSKTCKADTKGWGERICFDDQGKFQYFYYLECRVGETLYDVKSIVVANNKMVVEYQSHYWTDTPKRYKRTKYKVVSISEDFIELRRVL